MKNNSERDSKKILTMLILIMVFMVVSTGSTYAYFAISKNSVNVISGVAASTSLEITTTKIFPNNTNNSGTMVPQLKNGLSTAMGANNYCVDGNKNIVCEVLKLTIKNNSTATINTAGYINFLLDSNAGAYTNLKWMKITCTTASTPACTIPTASTANYTGVSYKAKKFTSTEASNATTGTRTVSSTMDSENEMFLGNVKLGKAGTTDTQNPDNQTYYIVIWIEETINTDQSSIDKGTWSANLVVQDSAGKGLTSTIIS